MGRRRGRAAVQAGALLFAVAAVVGCATYYDHLQQANLAAAGGDYAGAVNEMNRILGVGSTEDLPETWKGDRVLAALERGVLLQSLERYRDAARDLSAGEQEIELLDLTLDAIGALGQYLYSDSAQKYKAPPVERLALNPLNLLNYLANGDLDGAAVEARRFQVMREFLQSEGMQAEVPALLGAYLAGFVFERRGEGDRALRYYEEALGAGRLASLTGPVSRLVRVHPYRGPNLRALLEGHVADGDRGQTGAELLVVLNLGRVSHKVPERMPIGAAIGLAGTYFTGDSEWLLRGATKVLVYPEMVATPSSLGRPLVRLDGREIATEELVDLDAAVRREYEEMKPKIIAAALTRLAARAAVAEGARAAGNQESDAVGALLGILTEGVLVALDRPDTRSWTMLPAQVRVARVPVSAGEHTVEVTFSGPLPATRRQSVRVPADGYAAAVVTEPR